MSNNNLTWLEISRDALLHNLAEFRKIISPDVKLLVVVKANAYGHGIKEVARVISQKADWFGVNNLEEAKTLKDAGVLKPILILGYTPLSQLPEVVKNNFRLVAYNRQTIDGLGKILTRSKQKTVNIHLKLETGTNRQGIGSEEIVDFIKLVKCYPSIGIEGLYTHFADIEDSQNLEFAEKQLNKFKDVMVQLEKEEISIPLKHTTCTAATILLKDSHFNLVRLGIGLYGLWPSEKIRICARRLGLKINLKPVLTWKTRVAQIKKVKKRERVGYGGTFTTRRASLIVVLPVGYFDGYDRKLSNCGEVLISGKRASVTGRVCMNMMMVDVTRIKNVDLEEEVVLLGRQGREEITADEIAQKIGTINYEVVSRINPLPPRLIV